MTEADDNNVVDLRDVDRVFEQILAGERAAPDAPAWCGDLARLVAGAQAAPTDEELSAGHDIVRAMAEIRRASDTDPAATDPAATAHPMAAHPMADDGTDALVALWSTTDRPPSPGEAPHAAAAADLADDDAATGDAAAHAGSAGAPARRLPAAGDGRRRALTGLGAGRRGPRHVSGRPRHAVASTTATDARPVGRLLAARTAAVTTAVIVGTVAAAAATTGIVSGVVVPTLAGRVVKTPTSPSTIVVDDDQGATSPGDTLPGGDETVVTTPSCPTLVLVCSPLTPAGEGAPGTADGADGAVTTTPAKSGATGLGAATTTTTAPSSSEPSAATTTTTVPDAPPPTVPEATTTTSTTAPETPPPTDPPPVGTYSTSDPATQSTP